MTRPAMKASTAVTFPPPELRAEPTLIEAFAGPIPMEQVRSALSEQAELPAPAKLIVSEHGDGGLLAEIPRIGERSRCEMSAHAAIEAAFAWLRGKVSVPIPASAKGDWLAEGAVEKALERLPWPWEAVDDRTYRIHATDGLADCRVEIHLYEGQLRVSTAPMALRANTPPVVEALQLFALEANRTLRLARLTITEAKETIVRALWDAYLPSTIEPDPALSEIVAAVVCARAETAPALRALRDPRLSFTYLQRRSPVEPLIGGQQVDSKPVGNGAGKKTRRTQ